MSLLLHVLRLRLRLTTLNKRIWWWWWWWRAQYKV